MAKLLLITLIFSVCIYLNHGIQLRVLCKNSTFQYQGKYQIKTPVNSVHKLSYVVDLMKYIDYMIDESIDFSNYFKNTNDVSEMENLRIIYNNKVMKIYSYNYIYGLKDKENGINSSKDISDMKDYYQNAVELGEKCKDDYKRSFTFGVKAKIINGNILLQSFDYYINKNSFDKNNQTKLNEIKHLIETIDDYSNKELSFQYDTIEYVFQNHQIVEFESFRLQRVRKQFFDLQSSGYLSLNIILPFHNFLNQDENCLTTDDLPYFYRKNKL